MTKLVNKDWAISSSLTKRYTDAYTVAVVITASGKVVKIIGIVLAIVITLGVLLIAIQQNSVLPLIGNFPVIVIGCFFWLVGLLICAQGQILKASLDCAVNGSPLIDNDVKAEIMRISESNTEAGTSNIGMIGSRGIIMGALNPPIANAPDDEIIEFIETIQQSKDKAQIPFLIECLHHNTSDVRWQATDALGEIRDASALEALKPLLADPDKYVSQHAKKAMDKISGT